MKIASLPAKQNLFDWFKRSPTPSNILFGSSVFFTGVAVTSAVLTKAIVPIALTTSATLVVSALAIGTFALYLLLKPKHPPHTPFTLFPVDQKLLLDTMLVTYLQPDKLYRLIFCEDLRVDEKMAFQTIPHEIRKEIEEQKRFIEVMSQEKVKQAQRKIEHFNATISEQKESLYKLRYKQEVLDQFAKEIAQIEHDSIWEHCLEVIQFNHRKNDELLAEETQALEENEEKRTQLLNTPSPYDELYETLRKNLCTHIHQLLSSWVLNNQFSH